MNKASICNTCLSSERKVFNLKEDQDAIVVCKELKLGLNKKSTTICWECRAILHKVVQFKETALRAQCTLKLKNFEKIVTLSSLKIKTLEHEYVYDIKEEEDSIIEDYAHVHIKEEKDYIKPDFHTISSEQERHEVFVTDIKNEEVLAPNYSEIILDNFSLDDEKIDDNDLDDDDFVTKNGDESKKCDSDSLGIDDFNIKEEDMYKKVVLNDNQLQEHRDVCRNRLAKASILIKCDTCVVGFHTENALIAHNEKLHTLNQTPFKCVICETYFKRLGRLKIHYENHYNLYQCIKCDYKSDKRPSVVEHYQRHHTRTIFSCRVCKQRFEKHTAMLYHRRTAHMEVECKVCGKVLKEKYTLKMHMLLHTGMPMYTCDMCQKRYRGKWGIKAHMKSVHGIGAPKNENAYCTECNAQFRSVYYYNQHLKNHSRHILERLFCDMCDKSFTTKSHLTNHIMLVHEKSSKHSCTTCNKLFAKRSMLLAHIKYVHYKVEKPKRFECSVCHKRFAAKTVLNDHLNLHTGNRPYKCDMCEATFPNQGVLYRHKKFVHKIKKLSERTEGK